MGYKKSLYNTLVVTIIFCAQGVSANSLPNNCERWLHSTLKVTEAELPINRYQKVLQQLAIACSIIPSDLKKAAKQSLEKKDTEQLAVLLMATALYFSGNCLLEAPDIPASELPPSCTRENATGGAEFKSIQNNIDAANYMFGQVLQAEFIKAGVYKKYGKRILLNYFQSAALNREARLEQ